MLHYSHTIYTNVGLAHVIPIVGGDTHTTTNPHVYSQNKIVCDIQLCVTGELYRYVWMQHHTYE